MTHTFTNSSLLRSTEPALCCSSGCFYMFYFKNIDFSLSLDELDESVGLICSLLGNMEILWWSNMKGGDRNSDFKGME